MNKMPSFSIIKYSRCYRNKKCLNMERILLKELTLSLLVMVCDRRIKSVHLLDSLGLPSVGRDQSVQLGTTCEYPSTAHDRRSKMLAECTVDIFKG